MLAHAPFGDGLPFSWCSAVVSLGRYWKSGDGQCCINPLCVSTHAVGEVDDGQQHGGSLRLSTHMVRGQLVVVEGGAQRRR